jgi:hypothetical protein
MKSIKLWSIISGGIFAFYLGFINHVEPGEVGLARNLFTGQLWLQQPGWGITPPWVQIAVIDTKPIRVKVPTSGRGYSAKLVQFVPEAYESFIETEGFRYYWWSNRISFNLGYSEESRGIKDVLRGHAYSPKTYPFLKVIEESGVSP